MLFLETLQDSSLCKSELLRLSDDNTRLKAECLQLREELSQKDEGAGLTPVLSHVKKLVGKLGNDTKEVDDLLKGDGKYVSIFGLFFGVQAFFAQALLLLLSKKTIA